MFFCDICHLILKWIKMGAIGLGWHPLGCYSAVPSHASMVSTSHFRLCLLCVQLTRSEFGKRTMGIAPMSRHYGKKHYSALRELGELRPQDYDAGGIRTRRLQPWKGCVFDLLTTAP